MTTQASTNDDSTGCIPLIDFSPFTVNEGVVVGEAPTAAQRKVAQQLDAVNRQHGFLALTHFGLTTAQRNDAFAAAHDLFALPHDVKLHNLLRTNPKTNTGYAPFAAERLNTSRPPDLKESFNVRFPTAQADNPAENPLTTCPLPTFPPLVQDVLLPTYRTLAARYALACAVALDLPQIDFFAQHLQQYDLCTLRFLHYPPCDAPSTAGPGVTTTALRIGEHTDFGAFTFLMVHPKHGPAGLQIKPVAGGEVGGAAAGEAEGWHNVVLPSANGNDNDKEEDDEPILIVNTGALLARWTNDTWKATAHRVIVPDAAAAAQSRYSIACFIDPDTSSLITVHPSFLQNEQDETVRYPPITSSDYLAQKLQTMQVKS